MCSLSLCSQPSPRAFTSNPGDDRSAPIVTLAASGNLCFPDGVLVDCGTGDLGSFAMHPSRLPTQCWGHRTALPFVGRRRPPFRLAGLLGVEPFHADSDGAIDGVH